MNRAPTEFASSTSSWTGTHALHGFERLRELRAAMRAELRTQRRGLEALFERPRGALDVRRMRSVEGGPRLDFFLRARDARRADERARQVARELLPERIPVLAHPSLRHGSRSGAPERRAEHVAHLARVDGVRERRI